MGFEIYSKFYGIEFVFLHYKNIKMKKLSILFAIGLVLSSCGTSSKTTSATTSKSKTIVDTKKTNSISVKSVKKAESYKLKKAMPISAKVQTQAVKKQTIKKAK